MVLKCARVFIKKATKMGLATVAAKGYAVFTAFEAAGGVDALEALQSHPNFSIYKKAHKMLSLNFEEERGCDC